MPEMLSNVRIKDYFMYRKGRPEKVLRASRVLWKILDITYPRLDNMNGTDGFHSRYPWHQEIPLCHSKDDPTNGKQFLPSGKMFPSLKPHHMLQNKTEQATSCHRYVSWKGILLSNITGSNPRRWWDQALSYLLLTVLAKCHGIYSSSQPTLSTR